MSITISLKSVAELEHYVKIFENTIFTPAEELINNEEKIYRLTLRR